MGEVTTIGLDLAKTVFQIHGADETGRAVIRKQLRRNPAAGAVLRRGWIGCSLSIWTAILTVSWSRGSR